MKGFSFTLVYQFQEALLKPQDLVDKLDAEGCTDAFTGFNDKKKVSLNFTVEASSMSRAVLSARQSVSDVVNNAIFKEMLIQEDELIDAD